jgi:branched-chain amino acid transport system ATP-binding protein
VNDVLLETVDLNRYFGGLHAVQDVSFTARAGDIKAIIGPNGAGKTTLFNLIAGSFPPHSGTVLFKGKDITNLKPHAIAKRGLLRTFQTTKLFPHMTVVENVMVGRHTQSKAGFVAGMLNLPFTWREERTIQEKAVEILDLLKLIEWKDELAGNLPFGRQRMVEFARAIATEAELLLLDEPAAGLNIHETAELSELLRSIRDLGKTLLIVEHDMSLVMDISDEILVLDHGMKIAEGDPETIRKSPEVIKVYLGEDDA